MVVCITTLDAMIIWMLLHDFGMGAYEPMVVHNEYTMPCIEFASSLENNHNYEHIGVMYCKIEIWLPVH